LVAATKGGEADSGPGVGGFVGRMWIFRMIQIPLRVIHSDLITRSGMPIMPKIISEF
jgi:hypothetical protein